MLLIKAEPVDAWDERKNEFVVQGSKVEFEIEHSLVSLSKWESRWEKPFLAETTKTDEETWSYIEDMCLTPGIDPEVFKVLGDENYAKITEYIAAKMTATWFSDNPKSKTSSEVVTAEVIYYWLVALQIPFETEHWHLNRLLTLVRVCNAKNAPQEAKKKVTTQDLANRRQLNQQRKAQNKTTG